MVSKKNHAIRGNTKTLLTLTYNATVMVTLGHGLPQKKKEKLVFRKNIALSVAS